MKQLQSHHILLLNIKYFIFNIKYKSNIKTNCKAIINKSVWYNMRGVKSIENNKGIACNEDCFINQEQETAF